MVWSVGMGRMKAFARLLEAGSFTKFVQPDDVRKQKLTVADIRGELHDANEPNLLDENDMHVFGLKPMDDPLYLVSCNFCKKTINASQYASHAELCKYLGFQKACAEVAEAEDNRVRKNTTRKKINKVARVPPGKQTQLESTKIDDSIGSKSCQDDHIGPVSSLSTLTDDSLDGMPKVDVSSVNFGTEDFSTSTVGHLKRCKLMDAKIMVKQDVIESQDASRCQDVQTCKEISRTAINGDGEPHTKPLDHQKTNVPAPLATKIYYSQRSNHLRSALSLMFHKASEISSGELMSSEALEANSTSPEACAILDELGYEFSDLKEPVCQTMGCGPAFGFRTVADFRTTTDISGRTYNNSLSSTASLEMLNR